MALSCSSITSGYISGIKSEANTFIVNINNNVFPFYNVPNTVSTAVGTLIACANPGGTLNLTGTSIQNVTVKDGTFDMINCGNTGYANITTNTITNMSVNAAVLNVIRCSGVKQSITNNRISNAIYSSNSGINNVAMIVTGNGEQVSVNTNTITNVQGTSLYGIYVNTPTGNTFTEIKNNSLTNFNSVPGSTVGAFFTGIGYGKTSYGNSTVTISGNTIYSVTSVSNGTNTYYNSASMSGITVDASSSTYSFALATISNNKISSLSSSGYGYIKGIRVANVSSTVYNNIIGDLKMNNSSQPLAITGIEAQGYDAKVYFNTVNINNTTNTGFNAGSTAFATGTGTFTLKNNIFINTSVATGTGVTSVITATGQVLTNYSSASNNNLLYAGTPSANKVIMLNGNTAYSTLTLFKAYVTPRDAQSVSENPPFITTNGALPNTLNLNPAIASQAESGGNPVAGITTDYAGTIRNATTPDIGAWEGNFTAADVAVPHIAVTGFTGGPCNLTNRTMTVSITDASGVATGALAPRVYYRVNGGTYTSVQGTLISGTATNGVWSFNLTYSAAFSDVIYYFIAMQDQSYLVNVGTVPSAGSVASDVNSVTLPPVSPNTYTIETMPTISVGSGTVCVGHSYTITPSGAATYTYSGGSAVVSPVANTSYTITGASAGGCRSTNTVIASITVKPSPTITVNSGAVCAGQSFTMVPAGAVSYTYQGGTAIVSPPVTNTYAVSGSNTLGCTSTVISTVTINPAPVLQLAASQRTICPGENTILTASGASSYNWQPAGGTVAQVTVTPAATTAYTVTGTGANGCSSHSVITINVKACVVGIEEIAAGQSILIYPNPSNGKVTIDAKTTGQGLSIKIYNTLSQVIYNAALTQGQVIADLTGEAKGLYFVRIYNNDTLLKQEKIILD